LKAIFTKMLSVCALVISTASLQAEVTTITGTLVGDAKIDPNSSTGTGGSVPLFAFYKSDPPEFAFNSHYSTMIIKWNLTVPPALVGQPLKVKSAKVVTWNQKDAAATWVPGQFDLKMYATGITGDNGFTTATWTETQGYVGPGAVKPLPPQDPYLVELGTGLRAEDNLNATAWSYGEVSPVYNGTVPPAEAFPITFNLDVNNPEIQSRLKTNLADGIAMWSIVSTYPAAFGGPGSSYPRLVAKEGVGNTTYGTLQQAPALILEVEPVQSSVRDWVMY